MRLTILDKGHGFRTKALFAFIRLVTRQPTPEIIKLIGYRPAFFGAYMKKVTHEAMRGSSAWSVGDRELMAALVRECLRILHQGTYRGGSASVWRRAEGRGGAIRSGSRAYK